MDPITRAGGSPTGLHAEISLDASCIEEYDNGLKCSWLGRYTTEMTYDELIAFVGMLDMQLSEERAARQLMVNA